MGQWPNCSGTVSDGRRERAPPPPGDDRVLDVFDDILVARLSIDWDAGGGGGVDVEGSFVCPAVVDKELPMLLFRRGFSDTSEDPVVLADVPASGKSESKGVETVPIGGPAKLDSDPLWSL